MVVPPIGLGVTKPSRAGVEIVDSVAVIWSPSESPICAIAVRRQIGVSLLGSLLLAGAAEGSGAGSSSFGRRRHNCGVRQQRTCRAEAGLAQYSRSPAHPNTDGIIYARVIATLVPIVCCDFFFPFA